VQLAREGAPAECARSRAIAVRPTKPPALHSTEGTVRPGNAWNRGTENLYSAWIEKPSMTH
jgi:hypothetical protein